MNENHSWNNTNREQAGNAHTPVRDKKKTTFIALDDYAINEEQGSNTNVNTEIDTATSMTVDTEADENLEDIFDKNILDSYAQASIGNHNSDPELGVGGSQGQGSDNNTVDEVEAEYEAFEVGDIVDVASRTWIGINREGGRGKIKRCHGDGTYDISYIVHRGSDKDVPRIFISRVEGSAKRVVKPRCRWCKCFIVDCKHNQEIDEVAEAKKKLEKEKAEIRKVNGVAHPSLVESLEMMRGNWWSKYHEKARLDRERYSREVSAEFKVSSSSPLSSYGTNTTTTDAAAIGAPTVVMKPRSPFYFFWKAKREKTEYELGKDFTKDMLKTRLKEKWELLKQQKQRKCKYVANKRRRIKVELSSDDGIGKVALKVNDGTKHDDVLSNGIVDGGNDASSDVKRDSYGDRRVLSNARQVKGVGTSEKHKARRYEHEDHDHGSDDVIDLEIARKRLRSQCNKGQSCIESAGDDGVEPSAPGYVSKIDVSPSNNEGRSPFARLSSHFSDSLLFRSLGVKCIENSGFRGRRVMTCEDEIAPDGTFACDDFTPKAGDRRADMNALHGIERHRAIDSKRNRSEHFEDADEAFIGRAHSRMDGYDPWRHASDEDERFIQPEGYASTLPLDISRKLAVKYNACSHQELVHALENIAAQAQTLHTCTQNLTALVGWAQIMIRNATTSESLMTAIDLNSSEDTWFSQIEKFIDMNKVSACTSISRMDAAAVVRQLHVEFDLIRYKFVDNCSDPKEFIRKKIKEMKKSNAGSYDPLLSSFHKRAIFRFELLENEFEIARVDTLNKLKVLRKSFEERFGKAADDIWDE